MTRSLKPFTKFVQVFIESPAILKALADHGNSFIKSGILFWEHEYRLGEYIVFNPKTKKIHHLKRLSTELSAKNELDCSKIADLGLVMFAQIQIQAFLETVNHSSPE